MILAAEYAKHFDIVAVADVGTLAYVDNKTVTA